MESNYLNREKLDCDGVFVIKTLDLGGFGFKSFINFFFNKNFLWMKFVSRWKLNNPWKKQQTKERYFTILLTFLGFFPDKQGER